MESTLRFLLSARSAYDSGQTLRLAPPHASAVPPADRDRPLAGRTALVTGAAQGIGAAVAEALHRDGARVVCLDVPAQAEPLHRLAARLDGVPLVLDITADAAADRLHDGLHDCLHDGLDGLDVLVHNAGITRDRPLGRMDAERWRRVMEVNLTAVERLTTGLLPRLPDGARVVCTSSLSLMTRRDFPFPVLGLVHIANRIEQLRPIGVAERLSYRVGMARARPHARGTAFDVLVEAASAGGRVVWRSASTYLSRERRPAGSRRPDPPPAGTDREPWPVPAATGRRYAAVSGDRNPIHLHPLTARPFGFRRPTAHGMWSKARCLAALALPEAFAVEVSFRAPVPLPSRVVLRTAADGTAFALLPADGHDQRPYLHGRVTSTLPP